MLPHYRVSGESLVMLTDRQTEKRLTKLHYGYACEGRARWWVATMERLTYTGIGKAHPNTTKHTNAIRRGCVSGPYRLEVPLSDVFGTIKH